MAVFAFMGGYIYMEAKWNEESTYKLKEEIIQLERSLQLEQDKMKPRNPVLQKERALNNRIKTLNEEIKKYKEKERGLREEIEIWQQSESRAETQIKNEKERANNLKEKRRKLRTQIKNLEKSAEEQEDEAKALQKKINSVKAKVPCVRILAYHWDFIREEPLNDLMMHWKKMDTVMIKLKFIFVYACSEEDMKPYIQSVVGIKDKFANLDVEFLKIDNDKPELKKENLVNILTNKYNNLRVNQLFLIGNQEWATLDTRHYTSSTDKFTKTDLRNIEKIMQINEIICAAM